METRNRPVAEFTRLATSLGSVEGIERSSIAHVKADRVIVFSHVPVWGVTTSPPTDYRHTLLDARIQAARRAETEEHEMIEAAFVCFRTYPSGKIYKGSLKGCPGGLDG